MVWIDFVLVYQQDCMCCDELRRVGTCVIVLVLAGMRQGGRGEVKV